MDIMELVELVTPLDELLNGCDVVVVVWDTLVGEVLVTVSVLLGDTVLVFLLDIVILLIGSMSSRNVR